jgi:glycosyltransferase involved in cell wall biosynthesis
MQFSIIIPTYQRNDLLALCLQRLQPGAQTLEANLYEVIVTDDAADPATQQLLHSQFPWATYTAGPQRGPAANRNHGASLARGQWLVFTDDDCLPDANWLQAYANAIAQHPNTKAFEGAILPDDWVLLKKDMAECPVNTEGGCFWSANIMVCKDLFFNLGGFDESFPIAAMEDKDIYKRIKNFTDVLFLSSSVVIHPVRFVLLRYKLKRLVKDIESWFYYESKQNSIFKMYFKGMKFHLHALFMNLFRRKFKHCIYNVITLIILLPIVIYLKVKNILFNKKFNWLSNNH